jgi:CheY-like chemotaxis protein
MSMQPMSGSSPPPVVLLVEDDWLLRLAQFDILRHAGFSVVEARDADEALDALMKSADISIVLTDVRMPGSMNGLELAKLIAQGWPDTGIVVTSGLAWPAVGDLPPSAVFLSKPVHDEALLAHIRSLLARAKGRESR